MKIKSFLLACSLFAGFVMQAQNKSIKLIVRGDDMGYSHSGNEALIKCFKNGFETSIEIIVQ